jgi:signal transduction histidine kinase
VIQFVGVFCFLIQNRYIDQYQYIQESYRMQKANSKAELVLIMVIIVFISSCSHSKKAEQKESVKEAEKKFSLGVEGIYQRCVEINEASGKDKAKIASLRDSLLVLNKTAKNKFYVLKGSEPEKGSYLISPDGTKDGQIVLQSKDYKGDYYIKKIIEEAMNSSEGTVEYYVYPWKEPIDLETRKMTTEFVYFRPWDWVIVSSIYFDEMEW